MKKIILSTIFAILAALVIYQPALGATANVSVVPGFSENAVGKTFNSSINLNPQGNKVCVVMGSLKFSNLNCQSITVTSGVMSPVSLTCSNPSFIIGIPGCSSNAQNLLSITAKGNNVGQANITLEKVKVIGNGTNVESAVQNGSYNIKTQITQTIDQTQPNNQQAELSEIEVAEEEPVVTEDEPENTNQENNLPASVATASTSSAFKLDSPIVIAVLIIILALLAWLGIKKFVLDKKKA